MTVKDGFKLGVGFTLAKGILYTTGELLDKKSRIRKEVKRCITSIKGQPIKEEPAVHRPVTTVKNKIGFTIE